MAKVHFDSAVFDKKINPNVYDAKSNLSSARNTINNSSIPYDFVYKNTIRNFVGSIDSIIRKIDDFKLWANTTKTKIENAEQDYKAEVNKIEVDEIKIREKMV